MSSFCRLVSTAAVALAVAVPLAAQQPIHIDDDEITLQGCVGPVDPTREADAMLVWTRGDIMLAHVRAVSGDPVGTTGAPGPFFYWLEDEEELAQHVGQLIEVRGELGDFEEGEVKITRDDGFTEIELQIDGDTEKARVPTSWLGPAAQDDDREFEIVTRKIEVDEIRVLGVCPVR